MLTSTSRVTNNDNLNFIQSPWYFCGEFFALSLMLLKTPTVSDYELRLPLCSATKLTTFLEYVPKTVPAEVIGGMSLLKPAQDSFRQYPTQQLQHRVKIGHLTL